MSDRVCTCNSSTKDWGIHDWDCALEYVRKFPRDLSEVTDINHIKTLEVAAGLSSWMWVDGLTHEDYEILSAAVEKFLKNPRVKAD